MVDEYEWQTRRDRINKKLQSLKPSWKIIEYASDLDVSSLNGHAVEEFPTANGPADYALFAKGRLLGILEAKRVKVGPQNVLEQAKRYAKVTYGGCGNWDGYRVPFLYASNGEVIRFIDVRNARNNSRRLSSFHTADAMTELFESDPGAGFQALTANPIHIRNLRTYQKEAIHAVEAAMAKGKRAMLLAMATGTGKTFTTVSLSYRLLKAKAARRILFLVDRRALAAQTVREFASFITPSGSKFDKEYEVYSQRFQKEDFDEDKPYDPKLLPAEYLTLPQPSHTFGYVSTIQRMAVNLFGWQGAFPQSQNDPDLEDDAGELDIPIHAFDVIIADECHRGYTARETAVWRPEVLEELRRRLQSHDFPEKELQKAHKLVYGKDLADIISMVKGAVAGEAPLYSASERVDRALSRVSAARSFTADQEQWLDFIRQHLIENLTIEMQDFDVMPIFERQGGRGRARKVFRETLEALIAAALEFTRRRIRPEGLRISFPPEVLPLIRHLADRKQEHFLCISLNGANEVIAVGTVSVGLVDKTHVHPREVFADPITGRASAVIVAHNHPIGNLMPSREDLEMTRTLKAAGETLGIKLLDHILFQPERLLQPARA